MFKIKNLINCENIGIWDQLSQFFLSYVVQALTKLDQLEIQLVTTEHTPHSAGLVRLHAQTVAALDDATAGPLAEGHALLEITGRGAPGAEVSARLHLLRALRSLLCYSVR